MLNNISIYNEIDKTMDKQIAVNILILTKVFRILTIVLISNQETTICIALHGLK